MKCDYIIVQAGGKGTRMDYLTKNKPKALVPIHNLPMIFHLFKKYPEKKYIIIGDYKIDILKKYLKSFANVQYLIINANGKSGTCAGIKQAIKIIPNEEPFMLIWSDLILSKEFIIPDKNENYIGLSKDFRCRWRYENDIFEEIPSESTGVSGLFIFKEKRYIEEVPIEGEFVRWLRKKEITFKTIDLYKTKEYGLIEEYNKVKKNRCRPFNKLTITDNVITKEGIDEQGRKLAIREKAWYKKVKELGFDVIPKIYSFNPFQMEKINGKNVFEYDLNHNEKKIILKKISDCLCQLHNLGSEEVDYFSINEAYITKTFDRLNKIRDLVPFTENRYIKVNGRNCRNVFYFMDEVSEKFSGYSVTEFKFLHGDCTFSNMLLNEEKEPVLIDPRGYFGFTEIYGDEIYDWAKLYYSIKGNYDQFNLKNFRLNIGENEVDLEIKSNGWEECEDYFFELVGEKIRKEHIKLIHAIIWLSLTTYAWEDYDSICGAFYNGIYYLEEVL